MRKSKYVDLKVSCRPQQCGGVNEAHKVGILTPYTEKIMKRAYLLDKEVGDFGSFALAVRNAVFLECGSSSLNIMDVLLA